MVRAKKVVKKDKYYHVRFRNPWQFEQVRTAGWASKPAWSVSRGAQVRMGRTEAGTWLVQSVLIADHPTRNHLNAKNLASKIRKKIED